MQFEKLSPVSLGTRPKISARIVILFPFFHSPQPLDFGITLTNNSYSNGDLSWYELKFYGISVLACNTNVQSNGGIGFPACAIPGVIPLKLNVHFDCDLVPDNEITAFLVDGRTISVSVAWSWRLSEATQEQRLNSVIIGDGIGIHWPDIDEDMSVAGMLYGSPAPRPRGQ